MNLHVCFTRIQYVASRTFEFLRYNWFHPSPWAPTMSSISSCWSHTIKPGDRTHFPPAPQVVMLCLLSVSMCVCVFAFCRGKLGRPLARSSVRSQAWPKVQSRKHGRNSLGSFFQQAVTKRVDSFHLPSWQLMPTHRLEERAHIRMLLFVESTRPSGTKTNISPIHLDLVRSQLKIRSVLHS